MQRSAIRSGAAIAALATAMAFATADSSAASWDACVRLADAREQAARKQDLAGLHRAALEFVATCRRDMSRTEVAAAMAEVSFVRRTTGQAEEALKMAQDCIGFEYLGLNCHIAKAMAMSDLGMKSEARQVLNTAREVKTRLVTMGNHDLQRAANARGRRGDAEIEKMTREANARLRMAQRADYWIEQTERSIGAP